MIKLFSTLFFKRRSYKRKAMIFPREEIWDFNGGIHPPEMKNQSSNIPLKRIPLPERFVVPIKQHLGVRGKLCVKEGDHVLRGQPLTFGQGHMLPVHAPTSGQIISINLHSVAHPSSLTELCVIINTDGEDRWVERDGWNNYRSYTQETLIERIYQCGVSGLGGAGFPTDIKLRNSINRIETLIINAAECEPYITADDRLIQDYAEQVVEGIRVLAYILNQKKVLIGIEDNKKKAIVILRAVLADSRDIVLRVIPTKYPSGSARLLTRILTGKKMLHGEHLSDIGVLVQNIGTAYAVKRAVIDGEPMTERIVTVTGKSVSQPGNFWVRFGTPVRYLLDQIQLFPSNKQVVIMGGPFTGFTLPQIDVPVTKNTNCLLVFSESELGRLEKERVCIRCGFCADVCPMELLPQQLYWFSKGKRYDKLQTYGLTDCIECGACDWVCPSSIPLVQYFREKKSEIYAICTKEVRAAKAKSRFESRQARLKQEKIHCQNHYEQGNFQCESDKVRDCTSQNKEVVYKNNDDQITNNSSYYKIAVCEAIARIREKRTARKNKTVNED